MLASRAELPLAELSIVVPFTAITQAAARIQGEARQDALVGLVRRGNALATSISRGGGAEGVLEVLRRDHDLPLLVADRMGRRLAGTEGDIGDEELRVAAERFGPQTPAAGGRAAVGTGRRRCFSIEGAMGDIDAGAVLPATVERVGADRTRSAGSGGPIPEHGGR